ncbi:Crp/Fnr family transcriptional regulator [Enterovirga rhinocerotis]|nr:Crp/Fnr family transcriptional regulator [Enterovirga rhinocerotis]
MAELHVRNQLLAALAREERDGLLAASNLVHFGSGEVLHESGRPIEQVYFVESSLLSCLSGRAGRDQIEVAMIGRDGMAGISVALGVAETPFRIVAQRSGAAYRCPAQAFIRILDESASVRMTILRYAQIFTAQIAETGRANARQTVEARLARWLLMAHDRIDGNEIMLTHESLAHMLGVRRPGVTVALHVLEGGRMIRSRRGSIEILDRAKLEDAAQGSYGVPEAEYRRLIG